MLTIDTASGNVMDEIGKCVERHGGTDASGLRRAFVIAMADREYFSRCARLVPSISLDEVNALRDLAIKEWGEPEGE